MSDTRSANFLHYYIIKLSRALGYSSNEEGICHGIGLTAAVMALDEGGLDAFDKYILAIRSSLKNMTVKQLADTINKMHSVYTNQAEKAARKYIKKLFGMPADADFEASNLPDEYKESYHAAIRENIRKRKEELPDYNLRLFDMHCFLGPIEMASEGYLYEHLFAKKGRALTQNNKELILPLIMSQKLIEHGGVNQCGIFFNVGTEERLARCFQSLRQLLQNITPSSLYPISFFLESKNHVMTIVYDPNKKSFSLVEDDQLPSLEIKNDRELAHKVVSAFSSNGIAIFSATVYARNNVFFLSSIPRDREPGSFLLTKDRKNKQSLQLTYVDRNKTLIAIPIARIKGLEKTLQQLSSLEPEQWSDKKKTVIQKMIAHYQLGQHIDQWQKKWLIVTPDMVRLTDSEGNSLFYLAVEKGNVELARQLLDNGANCNQFEKTDEFTPLGVAVSLNYPQIVRLLSKKQANYNLVADKEEGETPLFLAVKKGHVHVATILLREEADPNQTKDDGMTPLHYAAHFNQLEIMQILLEQGADPNQVDKKGSTPLDYASRQGHHDVVALLTSKTNKTNPQQSHPHSNGFFATQKKRPHHEGNGLVKKYNC